MFLRTDVFLAARRDSVAAVRFAFSKVDREVYEAPQLGVQKEGGSGDRAESSRDEKIERNGSHTFNFDVLMLQANVRHDVRITRRRGGHFGVHEQEKVWREIHILTGGTRWRKDANREHQFRDNVHKRPPHLDRHGVR